MISYYENFQTKKLKKIYSDYPYMHQILLYILSHIYQPIHPSICLIVMHFIVGDFSTLPPKYFSVHIINYIMCICILHMIRIFQHVCH